MTEIGREGLMLPAELDALYTEWEALTDRLLPAWFASAKINSLCFRIEGEDLCQFISREPSSERLAFPEDPDD